MGNKELRIYAKGADDASVKLLSAVNRFCDRDSNLSLFDFANFLNLFANEIHWKAIGKLDIRPTLVEDAALEAFCQLAGELAAKVPADPDEEDED